MANWKAQAWVTSAVDNNSVSAALTLAQSLKNTKTTRKLAVISSNQVSTENRAALRHAFDFVHILEERSGSGTDKPGGNDILAKIYAFSMVLFEKCVFLSANSLFLENADFLFDGKHQAPLSRNDASTANLSIFMLRPNKTLYLHMWENLGINGLQFPEKYLSKYISCQSDLAIPKGTVTDFCVSTGKLHCDGTHAPIVQFVGKDSVIVPTTEEIEKLRKLDLGLIEKKIVQTWLAAFQASTFRETLETPPQSNNPYDDGGNEPIAIVGMSCRYPGANTLEEYWNLLYAGVEAIREPPAFRWTKEHSLRVSPEQRKSLAGFLSIPVDEFDARFFGVSPKDATYMDPQGRLLHEVLWESLEDAGIDPHSLYGTHTGIFTGSWMTDYRDIAMESVERENFRTYMGNSMGATAARLSFLLGLTGPSVATESGCSSSIVAFDLAVKSLRSGETHLALAGGVNLILHPFTANFMEHVISPGGRCNTFDAKADGFGRAEGCGVLVLKRLSDALQNRDNIWAVVRGSAVSQEGVSRSLGTPTVHCESLAMQRALQDANIPPEKVSFIETHGTGTAVGDPMEIASIAKAYYTPRRTTPIVIGSVKTNVGHAESCSGITGIMKAVLALQHELIPKHRNLETLNPEIFLDSVPATIPLDHVTWPKIPGESRYCSVSSFGITGTDGHVILEEAPDFELPKFTTGLVRPNHVMTISAKSAEALQHLLKEYEKRFSEDIEGTFADAAYSANVGRASFSHRAVLVAASYQEAAQTLKEQKYLQGTIPEGQNTSEICFLFTGQGSQYPGMARQLYDTSPVFRYHFDACERTLREKYNLSIRQVLWDADPDSKELSRTIYSQTSIFCVEYCLLKLWNSWGVKPDYVLGHSLGEFCAAVAANVLSFEDALKLVAERSRLIDSLPRGKMLVIKAGKSEVEKLMKTAGVDLDFAAVNTPEQTVVAGDSNLIEIFHAYLKNQGLKAVVLEATHAFHSRHMDPMLKQYRKVAETVKLGRGDQTVRYVSGVEGKIIDDLSELNADYWVRHTREKVSFTEACAALRESADCPHFLEVGPQPVLSSFVMTNDEDLSLDCLPSLRRGTDDWKSMLTSLGKLYLLGHKINWRGYDEPYIRKKISLPFHPFYRKSYWVETAGDKAVGIHPLVGAQMKNASALHIFQNDLTVKFVPYLKDHCIGNRIVYPGAGYTEMCLAAGYAVANGLTDTLDPPTRAIRVENVRIDAPLELKDGKNCRFQVIVDLPEAEGQVDNNSGFRVKVYHQNSSREESGKWILHASSIYNPVASVPEIVSQWKSHRIPEILSCSQPTSSDGFYKAMDDKGLRFGESFRAISNFWTNKEQNAENLSSTSEIITQLELPPEWQKYILHPLIIDSMFQTGLLITYLNQDVKLRVPITIGQLTVFPEWKHLSSSPTSLYLHAWEEGKGKSVVMACTVPDCIPVACIQNVETLDTTVRTIESVLEQQSSAVPDAWEEVWKPLSSQPFTASVERPVDLPAIMAKQQLKYLCPEESLVNDELEQLLYLYILNALQELGWQPTPNQTINPTALINELGIQSSFQQLVRYYCTVLEQEGLLQKEEGSSSWKVVKVPPTKTAVQQQMSQLEATLLNNPTVSVVTTIFQHIAGHLANILTGSESALSLLFPVDPDKMKFAVDNYYLNHPSRTTTLESCSQVLRRVSQDSFALNGNDSGKVFRVLEVGAGTGAMSLELLRRLKEIWGDRFEYYYTDLSPSFFAKAEKRLEEFGGQVMYKVFNLEQSPLSQGVPLEHFDIVCGSEVLHATRNLEETLIHLRQTLKPGGVLFFTESLAQARDNTFLFGLLEGYWRFEDKQWRPHHCCVSPETWAQIMTQCGYHEIERALTYVNQSGWVAGVASPNVPVHLMEPRSSSMDENREKRWIIFADATHLKMNARVANTLVASGYHVTLALPDGEESIMYLPNDLNRLVQLQSIQRENETHDEMDKLLKKDQQVQGVIYSWGQRQGDETEQKSVVLPFLNLCKTLSSLVKPPPLFVVTCGVHALSEDIVMGNPSAATLSGMAKVLKNENGDMFVRRVDLEGDEDENNTAAQLLFELASCKAGPKEQQRVQVTYRGNVRHEPRLVKAILPGKSDMLKLPPSTDRYHLALPKSRMIQDLEFVAQQPAILGENQVEVKVKAFALNFKDVLAIIKPSAEFDNLNAVGLDFAGVITKAGAKSEFKVGDRVFGANLKEAQLPSHLVVDTRVVHAVPENVNFCEAATIPIVFLTAYYCLIDVAKINASDTVLIHTGSGGVGLAAIRVAKYIGANIISTAGNKRKRAYLRRLGIEHVFHSRDTSYEQEIMRVTNGRGVNVVLNSITGPGIKEATLRATAPNARFVEMSKLSVWSPEEVKALRPDVDYNIVDLTGLDDEKYNKLRNDMHDLFKKGQVLSPIPYVKFDALYLRQALSYLQKAKHVGKVVVSMPEVRSKGGQFTTEVPVFNGDSTYLITGGLGGIGFEVCKWMLSLGATDIVLTGRSAPKPEVADQIKRLNSEKGVNVMVRQGDVGDFESCKAIIEEITTTMKPLRGVMHCAGVLKDAIYANQTWDSFNATFIPKIYGTWNLHRLTSQCSMEYFVVYSSITALVGTPGQPNHAAANCFEDAFIHYRHSLGLPGTTVNWGQWAQVGCAKEISLSGVLPVSVTRMLNGLEISLRSQKTQVCFHEFDSFTNFSRLCPSFRGYLDDRIWKQYTGALNNQSGSQGVKGEQFWKEMDGVSSQKEKEAVMANYLKNILRSALRLEADDSMSDTANLQELGVDSLMMIELKNSIQTLLGNRVSITVNMLKNCDNIRLLSQAVVGKLVDSEGDNDEGEESEEVELELAQPLPTEELEKLLNEDAILPEDVKPSADATPPVNSSQIKSILVTGTTGQLAPYLIANLDKCYSAVEQIICLVRGTGDETALSRKLKTALDPVYSSWLDSGKIHGVWGDVSQKNLGLSPEKYAELATSIDAVIHCAAKTHPMEHLRRDGKGRDIRSVNVNGTLNVLRFAGTGHVKRIYYPSSLITGMFGRDSEGQLQDKWPESSIISTIVNNNFPGMQTTKWICEMLLQQANQRGIPCKVFRFPWIAGDSETGRVNLLKNLYILRFLSFLKLGAMMELPIPANVLPVDICAELSLYLFLNDETPNEIFNLGHPTPDLEQEFARVAKEDFGKEVAILDRMSFVTLKRQKEEEEGEKDGKKTAFYKNQMSSADLSDAMEFAGGYLASPDTFFRNAKVEKLIENYGKGFPSSMDTVRRDLRYLNENGLLEKLEI